jgi:hypothetical protein
MDYGQQTTGTKDEHYNLISVLYHALHAAENCDRYASDAEIAGDERLAAFFREAQGMQTQLAERAKGMLDIGGMSLPDAFGVRPEGMVAPDAAPEDVPPRPGPEVPPGGVGRPNTTPGDVRRGTTPDTPPPRMDFPPGPS